MDDDQGDLFGGGGRSPDFDGKTYDPLYDHDRLSCQLGRVWEVMRDAQWRTLAEIHAHPISATDPEASISARLRDFRKEKFGAYTVEHRRRGDPSLGIWEYRLLDSKGEPIGNG